MLSLFNIIKKNLKLLIRARSSALIVVLAPLLIILLVGVAFDNLNTYGLNLGVMGDETAQPFIEQLREKEFGVLNYKGEERCVEDIKFGLIHACVIFPRGMDFESNEQQEITLYVDYSKMNLVWMVTDTLSTKISLQAREISKNLVGVVIGKLEGTKTKLGEKKPVIAGLSEENEAVLARMNEIDRSLAGLDLNVGENFSTTAVSSELSSFKGEIEGKINSSKKGISSARSKVGGLGGEDAEETVSEIKSLLTGASTDLEGVREKLTNATENASLAKVEELIRQVESQINEAKNKLTAAATVRGEAQGKIDEAQGSLEKSLSDIGAIEVTVNEILADIEGVKVTDVETIAAPVVTKVKAVVAEESYLNYLFPGLMVLVVMFISMLLGTMMVMTEKHSPAYFRNFIAPVRGITFVGGTFLTNMFLVVVQVGVILAIGVAFFSKEMLGSLPVAGLVLLIGAAFFSLLGMVVGYAFTSEETGTLASISLGSLLLMMSGMIMPMESMPAVVREIAVFNPFVIAEKLLREAILFGTKIELLVNDLLLLGGYVAGLFLVVLLLQKLMGRHFLERLTYRAHRIRKREKRGTEKEVKKGVRKEVRRVGRIKKREMKKAKKRLERGERVGKREVEKKVEKRVKEKRRRPMTKEEMELEEKIMKLDGELEKLKEKLHR